MPHPNLAVVTGAFSYTGRYVTRRLLDQGVRVGTLTRSPDAEDPFGGRVEVAPLDFSDPDGLCHSMPGADVFYNTYRIRFAHGQTTFDHAVENTRMLFEAAKRAGVGRIVHCSVTNVSSGSALPYFRGKAQGGGYAEGPRNPLRHHQADPGIRRRRPAAQQHGLGAAALSRLPVYGDGDYPVQPVYVEDLGAQAVEAGSQSENSVADAAGPDTFSFEALLRLLASSMDVRRWFLHTPPRVGLALTGLVGLLMRDMALTRDEVVGLMDGLLTSGEPPTGMTRLSDWLAENGDSLGRRYVSELRRNYRG